MSDPDKRRCKAGKAAKQTKDKKCHFKPSFMPTTPGAPFGGGTNPCGIQNKVLKAYFVKKCKAATGAAPSVKKAATKMDCTTMANKYVDCGAKCCYTNAWYM